MLSSWIPLYSIFIVHIDLNRGRALRIFCLNNFLKIFLKILLCYSEERSVSCENFVPISNVCLILGTPAPQLNWWREHALIDGSYENSEPHKTVNTLLLENLQRSDLHSILTCQASNNNISNPVSTSVKIDMHCKFRKG